MGLISKLTAALRKKLHEREIAESLLHFERHTGSSPARNQTFSDAGSFRSQVDRLFAIGNLSETSELKRLAEGVVAVTLTNRYYRAADYLSDIADDLERHTFLTGEPLGEPPLTEPGEGYPRELKLKAVREAWLVPLKVASMERALITFERNVGRELPYRTFEQFERSVARLFALIGESEIRFVEGYLERFFESWPRLEEAQRRSPARVVAEAVEGLQGRLLPEGIAGLRTRRADQPLRLSTVVHAERQDLLIACLSILELS